MSEASVKIESLDLSIESLYKDFYTVPDFQREYVWQREQVEKLLQDAHDVAAVAVVGGSLPDLGGSPTRRDGAGPIPGNGQVGDERQAPIVPLGAELRTGGAVRGKYADGITVLGAGVFWMIAVGFFSYWFTTGLFQQRRAAASYALVQARVLEATVGTTGSSPTVTYRPVVTYRYEVEGRTYSSSRYAYVNDGFDFKTAHGFAKAHPAGSTIQAFYDPTNPNEAVLHRGLPGLAWPILLFALFMGIGLAILGVGVRRIREAARQAPGRPASAA